MYSGHYIVLTLFLAVILETFESAYDENTEAEVIVADVVTKAALQRQSKLKSAWVKPEACRKVSASDSCDTAAVPNHLFRFEAVRLFAPWRRVCRWRI